MIRNVILTLALISVTKAIEAPMPFFLPSEKIGFEWLLDTASRNADYAARRKAAGKPEESKLIFYSLTEFLDLTNSEIDFVNSVACEYKESFSDLMAECRFDEIVWRRSHPSSLSGYPIWTAKGFPIDFISRKTELQTIAYNKLKTELSDAKLLYLKQNCYHLLAPAYGGTVR